MPLPSSDPAVEIDLPERAPDAPVASLFPGAAYRADLAACRTLLRTGSKSFFAASLLLPRRVREPASALYAFCRLADDAVDLAADPAAGLAHLHRRLDAAYRSRPFDHPVDRAFARTVEAHDIPRALPEALFEGFAWDAEGRRYETLGDLEAYAFRVAGTVGMMMSVLMERRSPALLARAADLGVAMQFTNIARDVGEDARAGRLYLPTAEFGRAGLDTEDFLRAPVASPGLARVVGDLLTVADDLYDRAASGIAALPADCRPAIRSASAIYREIGLEVRRNGLDSVSRRAVVGGRRKAALIAAATAMSDRTDGLNRPALPAARDLIARTAVPPTEAPPRTALARAVWLVDLFTRLERDDIARVGRPLQDR